MCKMPNKAFAVLKYFYLLHNLCMVIELSNTFWFRWLQQMLVRAQLGRQGSDMPSLWVYKMILKSAECSSSL